MVFSHVYLTTSLMLRLRSIVVLAQPKKLPVRHESFSKILSRSQVHGGMTASQPQTSARAPSASLSRTLPVGYGRGPHKKLFFVCFIFRQYQSARRKTSATESSNESHRTPPKKSILLIIPSARGQILQDFAPLLITMPDGSGL
ncbi:hypothetical protein F5Y15DRAFT_369015 [Xylariaceae sp. FL0016]|nr:hypothetical protein F5Y15DRAFT_369015 [Xylariaceae sp. FL0016]